MPDNLKAGVTHPCRYEPDLNPTYLTWPPSTGHGALLPLRRNVVQLTVVSKGKIERFW